VTSGGIVGTIVTLDDDTLVLRVKPDNIKIQMARSSVSSLVSSPSTSEVKK
jgi:preprotein translocase subunit YajC